MLSFGPNQSVPSLCCPLPLLILHPTCFFTNAWGSPSRVNLASTTQTEDAPFTKVRGLDYRNCNAITMSTMKIVTGTTHGTVSAKVIKTSFSVSSGSAFNPRERGRWILVSSRPACPVFYKETFRTAKIITQRNPASKSKKESKNQTCYYQILR